MIFKNYNSKNAITNILTRSDNTEEEVTNRNGCDLFPGEGDCDNEL